MNKSDFQQAFDEAIEVWRRRHRIRDDDVILLCLELFRIHQEHWDRLRRKDFPPFQEFRETILKLTDTATQIQRNASPLLTELRRRQGRGEIAPPTITAVLLAVLFALIAGVLTGKFLL
jgi:hypothetical protein